jgi:hypothetical protein
MSAKFNAYLRKFPELELPLTIDESSIHTFTQENEPLSVQMVEEFIMPYEIEEVDDLTEYVPCFRIANTKEFQAVVYWRAGLMSYQYVLSTFEKNGKFIDQRTLAGTYSNGKIVTNSVARIDEDWTIYVITGQMEDEKALYDASKSKTVELELLPDGKIVDAWE